MIDIYENFEEICLKLLSVTWKPSWWIAFVQMVTLTVAFFDWVSKTCSFSRSVRTSFLFLVIDGGFQETKKRLLK